MCAQLQEGRGRQQRDEASMGEKALTNRASPFYRKQPKKAIHFKPFAAGPAPPLRLPSLRRLQQHRPQPTSSRKTPYGPLSRQWQQRRHVFDRGRLHRRCCCPAAHRRVRPPTASSQCRRAPHTRCSYLEYDMLVGEADGGVPLIAAAYKQLQVAPSPLSPQRDSDCSRSNVQLHATKTSFL
jgi:hypothetical protein